MRTVPNVYALDAGELREYLVAIMARAGTLSVESAQAIGAGIDRLAALTGIPLPTILRELADDIERLREES